MENKQKYNHEEVLELFAQVGRCLADNVPTDQNEMGLGLTHALINAKELQIFVRTLVQSYNTTLKENDDWGFAVVPEENSLGRD